MDRKTSRNETFMWMMQRIVYSVPEVQIIHVSESLVQDFNLDLGPTPRVGRSPYPRPIPLVFTPFATGIGNDPSDIPNHTNWSSTIPLDLI